MNLKCPNCGGPVVYDVISDGMKCDHCNQIYSRDMFSHYVDTESTKATIKPTISLKQDTVASEQPSNATHVSLKLKGVSDTITDNAPAFDPKVGTETTWLSDKSRSVNAKKGSKFQPIKEYMEMKIYHCPSCGADLMAGQTQAATFCSYCGSPSIIYDRVSKEAKPSKIIPFKLSESQALSCIRDRFGHGKYIPPQIRKLTVEKIHAIYVPYWLYTAHIRKKILMHSPAEYGHYEHYRDVSCTYHNIPVDGALRLSNDFSKRLEPFYMNELEDFDISYLSGFYADTYDVSYDTFERSIQDRCHNYIMSEICASCPCSSNKISTKNGEVVNYLPDDDTENYELQEVTYALLPVYFINIQYKHMKELILVNGQTGKVVGNIPFETEQLVIRTIKNSLISCTIFSLLCILFLSIHRMQIVLILPILVAIVALINGSKEYNRYKSGMIQLASQHMISYVNRKEEQDL